MSARRPVRCRGWTRESEKVGGEKRVICFLLTKCTAVPLVISVSGRDWRRRWRRGDVENEVCHGTSRPRVSHISPQKHAFGGEAAPHVEDLHFLRSFNVTLHS